jgi:hypothetical protein
MEYEGEKKIHENKLVTTISKSIIDNKNITG